jgi:hypothetical protein
MSLKPGAWRKTSSKKCPNCHQSFAPRHDENIYKWERRKFCGNLCRARSGMETMRQKCKDMKVIPTGTPLDPNSMDTAGKRLRWLRLSYSTCGRKKAWPTSELSDRTGLSVYILEDIEKGNLRHLVGERTVAVCKALGIPYDLLTVSQSKFVTVVKSAGLLAKTISNTKA